ncbi:MAG: DUF3459 domain-containing protein, partial [Aeromonas sp.]
ALDQLARPDSPFHCYRQLIALRKAHPVIRHGDFTLLDEHDPHRISYRRRWQDPATGSWHTLLLLANLTSKPQQMPHFNAITPAFTLLLNNTRGQPNSTFSPYQCAIWCTPS